MAYQPGWSVIPQTVVRRERWPGGYRGNIAAHGVPLVYNGQEVQPDQPVLRMEHRMVAGSIAQDEVVPAGMHGRVVDITQRGGVVIEAQASVVRGEIGAGNQVAGILHVVEGDTLNAKLPAGAILATASSVSFVMLRQALLAGVSGIVAGSIAVRDLEGFLRTDIIQLLDDINSEQTQATLPPMTVLFTEGVGIASMPEATFRILQQRQGTVVLLSGITAPRQGIVPELILSFSPEEIHRWQPVQEDLSLSLGARVRVESGEHEGAIGSIDYIFAYEQVFPSGIRSRALRLRLGDGSPLLIPATLAQRIG